MSVATMSAEILDYLVTYDKARDAILADKTRTPQFKAEAANRLYSDSIPGAESLATRYWGTIEGASGQWELSPSGLVWKALEAAERDLNSAKTAAGVGIGDPTHNLARVQSIIAIHGDPAAMAEFYDQRATESERAALQDYAPGLIGTSARGWAAFMGRLERDRQQRMNTPAVTSAAVKLDKVMSQVEAGYAATKQLVDTFGRASWVLSTIPKMIYHRRWHERRETSPGRSELVTLAEIDRVGYGVAINRAQRFTPETVDGGSME